MLASINHSPGETGKICKIENWASFVGVTVRQRQRLISRPG